MDIDEERGVAVQRELDDGTLFLPCDVRDIPALTAVLAAAAERFWPVRVLVNNAADDRRYRVEDFDVALWTDRMASTYGTTSSPRRRWRRACATPAAVRSSTDEQPTSSPGPLWTRRRLPD